MKKILRSVCLLFVLAAVLLSSCSCGWWNENYFTDVDGTKYKIKKVDGIFALYDPDGEKCPTYIPPNYSMEFYVTKAGTYVDLDEDTGEYEVIDIPELKFEEDGETLEHLTLTVFKSIDTDDIRSLTVNNSNGSYTLYSYDFTNLRPDDNGDFVLKESPFSKLNDGLISYLLYYAGHAYVKYRLEEPGEDFSKYGLVAETRYDKNGNPYEYIPASYTLITTQDIKHTIILGDPLDDGSGYYIQYVNNDGVARKAVYVYYPSDMSDISGKGANAEIFFGKATDLVEPNIVYPMTNDDYFKVSNFTVSHRQADGSYNEVVDFSYKESENNSQYPYYFNKTSFEGYNVDYNAVDGILLGLMKAEILQINVLNPTSEDKVKYKIMSKEEQSDGTFKYTYSSKYIVEFDKVINDVDIRQTLYVSEPNENGNYHVFTEIRLLEAADDSPMKGFSICEVSPETMGFVAFEASDWVCFDCDA